MANYSRKKFFFFDLTFSRYTSVTDGWTYR